MQDTLVRDTENRINQGFKDITSAVPEASALGKDEPTKGVQTYIPMSMYRRLNDIKLTRRENIAALVSQSIALWLDVQEGKAKVNKVI